MDIYRWTAKRAGAAITIHGLDANGRPVKVTGITSVEPGPGSQSYSCVYARVKEGDAHRLLLRL